MKIADSSYIYYCLKSGQTITLSFSIVLSVSLFSYGQKSIRKDAVSAVNEIISGKAELQLKGRVLQLSTNDEDGQYRNDRVFYPELNPNTVHYDQNNAMIIVNCYEGDCVERVLYKQKIKRYYKRLSIPAKLEDEQVEDVIIHLKKLITG